MNCVLFLKCIKFSVKNKTLKNTGKMEKYWKSRKFVSAEKWVPWLMPRFKPVADCHHTV